MTADLAERYAHQLYAIAQRIAWAPAAAHQCEVYDPDLMEHERNPALPCVVCDIERILDKEPQV